MRLLYAAHFCLSEVHNGGFLQLFWNSTGVLVPEAIEGYQALGMPKLAATFASAAGVLGSAYPRDREEGMHCSTPQNALRMNWPESLKAPKTSTMDTQKQQLNFHSTRSIGTHGDRLNQKMADSRSER